MENDVPTFSEVTSAFVSERLSNRNLLPLHQSRSRSRNSSQLARVSRFLIRCRSRNDLSTTEMTNAKVEDTVPPISADLCLRRGAIADSAALRQPVETPAIDIVSTEPSTLQPTIPVTMPEPVQTPTAPVIRTPTAGGAPQPAGTMQTAVQLTFSFEIASMQLTPTFKMGALQLRPSSKVVTMRLAPSQQPQPAMNLQVTFEISKIQPTGGGLGTVRLTPSQQQRPASDRVAFLYGCGSAARFEFRSGSGATDAFNSGSGARHRFVPDRDRRVLAVVRDRFDRFECHVETSCGAIAWSGSRRRRRAGVRDCECPARRKRRDRHDADQSARSGTSAAA